MRSKRRNFIISFGLTVLCLILLYLYHRFAGTSPIKEWEHKSRNLHNYVDITSKPRIIPKDFCQKHTLVTVIINSKPSHFGARNVIRETWGQKRDKVTFVFLLGEENENKLLLDKIGEESDKFNDIIQESFIDSYYNLSIKTVNLLKTFTQHCTLSSKYLLKIDDDVFLNTERFINLLENEKESQNLLKGKVFNTTSPTRDNYSKWYMPYSWYSLSKYPNFLSGPAYWMSNDVPEKLLQCAFHTPLIHLEDVYLTGLCAHALNISRRHESSLIFYDWALTLDQFCENKEALAFHFYENKEMKQVFELQNEGCVNFKPKWRFWSL